MDKGYHYIGIRVEPYESSQLAARPVKRGWRVGGVGKLLRRLTGCLREATVVIARCARGLSLACGCWMAIINACQETIVRC